MKKKLLLLSALFVQHLILAQASGNINYQTQVHFPDQNINISQPSVISSFMSVKGLANVKADSYVAIFSVVQVGKTTEEVNELIDDRIRLISNEINKLKGVETHVDMISFVPVYEYEVAKKTFSKKTYNEVPVGFELRKNIHIKYNNSNQLNDFIKILSQQDIYDLVRVDYFASNQEAIKKELMNKAKVILQEKIKNYESLVGTTLTPSQKGVQDGYRVVLPLEMYKAYEAYNSSSLNLKKSANVNVAEKTAALYYQPIIDKEFDFVINPTIVEPVIQIMYEVKMTINRDDKSSKTKDYLLITPNGDIKPLQFNL